VSRRTRTSTCHPRLRVGCAGERHRYAVAKRQAASEANAGGEHVVQFNARKQQVIRDIYHRAFVAAGLLQQ
jgi:hypothetical protein